MTSTSAARSPDSDSRSSEPGLSLLSPKQVATILGCSPRHVARLVDSGAMPAPLRLGKLVRWRRGEIDAWIAEGCPGSKRGAR